jgi:hypothetical protein
MTWEGSRHLTRARSSVDRLRARMTVLAATGIGTVLLAVTSIVALSDSKRVLRQEEGLARFLAEPGLRPGTVLAVVLLVVPLAALAYQALRVGSLALHKQASLLTLAGATPGDLRRIRIIRAGSAFLLGGLLAGPAYLILWLLLGVTPKAGTRLVPSPQPWLPLAWLAVAGLLGLAGAITGIAAGARGGADPLARSRAPGRPPGRRVPVACGIAAVALFACSILLSNSGPLFAVALLLVILLVVATVSSAAARLAASHSRSSGRSWLSVMLPAKMRPQRHDAATAVLAAAQRRGNPQTAGAVAGVLFVCGMSFGWEAHLVNFWLNYHGLGNARFYLTGLYLAALVGTVSVMVALFALALSLTDHLLAARRSVASTAALGTETDRLVSIQARTLTATAVPAIALGALSYPFVQLLLNLSYARVQVRHVVIALVAFIRDMATAIPVALTSAVLVMLACHLLARLLAGRVRAAASLNNLRTP